MENQNPLVSVIIPFYNAEEYLEETLQSVLNQEYKNWEILLVNDGSTDQSTSIAKDYASQFADKIFYIEHEGHKNKAAAATRNLGVFKSKGELIALLDSDDIWTNNKLKDQVDIFNKFPQVKMTCGPSMYWYSWSNNPVKDEVIHIGVKPDQIYHPPELAIKLYPLNVGQAPCPSAITIKSSVLKAHGGFEESFIREHQVYEDQAFLSKIYLNECVYVSSSCNTFYRQRSSSVMGATKVLGHYHIARNFYLHWLKKYLEKNKIKNLAVHFLLWKALLPYKHPLLSKVVNRIPFLKYSL